MAKGRIEKDNGGYIIGWDDKGEFRPAHYSKPYKTRKGAERALKQKGWL